MAEYDTQQNMTTPLPASPRRLLYFALALTGLAVGCLTANTLITQRYWNPRMDIVSDVMDALDANHADIEIVFLGSSRLNSGINPLLFDEFNKRSGAATTSCSFWIPDTAVGDLDFMLETLQSTSLPRLQYIVFEPRLLNLPSATSTLRGLQTSAHSTRFRYIYDAQRIRRLLILMLGAKQFSPNDIKDAALLTLMGLTNLSNLGVLPDILLSLPDQSAGDERIARHRGHMPPKPSIVRKSELPEWQTAAKSYRPASQFDVDSLRYLITKIKAMGVTPVMYIPPVRTGIDREMALRDVVAERFPEVAILDYTNLPATKTSLMQPENWIDGIHLSKEGSILLSEMLSEDWLNR